MEKMQYSKRIVCIKNGITLKMIQNSQQEVQRLFLNCSFYQYWYFGD